MNSAMIIPRIPTNPNQIRHLSYKSVFSWYSGLVKRPPPKAPYTHIVQVGDPTLRNVADEIPSNLIKSPEIQFLINRMKKVMRNYNAVGLAAPQVGVPLRVFLIEFNQRHLNEYNKQERKTREMQLVPLQVVINPVVKTTDYTKLTFVERCESVKGFQADVSRFRGLNLRSFDADGNEITADFIGWSSRIVQHEMDHLNGRIYTDVMDRKSFVCSCWESVNNSGGKVELPYGPH